MTIVDSLQLMHSTPNENCALDASGKLKDASEVDFFNSPSDVRPISGPGTVLLSPSPPERSSRPVRNSNRKKFHQALLNKAIPTDIDDLESHPPAPAGNMRQAGKGRLVESDGEDDPGGRATQKGAGRHNGKCSKPLVPPPQSAMHRFLKTGDDKSPGHAQAQPTPLLPPDRPPQTGNKNSLSHLIQAPTLPVSLLPSEQLSSPSPAKGVNQIAANISIGSDSDTSDLKGSTEACADVLTIFSEEIVEKKRGYRCSICV